jgi:hypothetical protein
VSIRQLGQLSQLRHLSFIPDSPENSSFSQQDIQEVIQSRTQRGKTHARHELAHRFSTLVFECEKSVVYMTAFHKQHYSKGNTMKTAALRINESALIQNLKFSFSNSFTVLTELLQNARRSGADKIDVTFAEGVLTVSDNGSGLHDFQNLLSIAESGWDAKTVAQDTPFGMGFLAALFAADRVVVESNGYTMDMDTAHILSMNDVAIKPVSEFTGPGTRVSLHGVEEKAVAKIESLIDGSPIPVFYNGAELKRDYAQSDKFVSTEMGQVFIDYDKICKDYHYYGMEMRMFLQGFQVYDSHPSYHHGGWDVIVHLDSVMYKGRMPDRDKLVDEEDTVKAARKMADKMVEDWLQARLVELGGVEFAKQYGKYAFYHYPAMLNQLDFLPGSILTRPELGGLSQNSDRCGSEEVGNISKADIVSGKYMLFDNPDSLNDENIMLWQWILHHEASIVLDKALPEGHWAIPFAREEDGLDDAIEVTAINPGKSGKVNGSYLTVPLTLCDAVKLVFDGIEVLLDNHAVYAYGPNGILVPAKESEYCGGIVEAIESYTRDDAFNEDVFEEDSENVNKLVRRLRSQNFGHAIIDTLMREGIHTIEGVEGKQFLVSFGEVKDQPRAVEMGKVLAKLGIDPLSYDMAVQAALNDDAKKQDQTPE